VLQFSGGRSHKQAWSTSHVTFDLFVLYPGIACVRDPWCTGHELSTNPDTDLLAVDGLEEPKMAETAIDSLVMDSNNKELIKAIARIYTDSDQTERFSADFIQGKGEGQIILLHGPPGTGKTLTAGTLQVINFTYNSG
jgi:hypothetical protein